MMCGLVGGVRAGSIDDGVFGGGQEIEDGG